MEPSNNAVEPLRYFLGTLPQTESISPEDWAQLLPRLREAWNCLQGSIDQNTLKSTLDGAENVAWTPPFLTFTLERHGITEFGSPRAEIHNWQVNIETGVAEILSSKSGGYKRLMPPNPRTHFARRAD